MKATCECGMTLDTPGARTECHACGAACCRSCSIEIETAAYCRWCATSLGVAA